MEFLLLRWLKNRGGQELQEVFEGCHRKISNIHFHNVCEPWNSADISYILIFYMLVTCSSEDSKEMAHPTKSTKKWRSPHRARGACCQENSCWGREGRGLRSACSLLLFILLLFLSATGSICSSLRWLTFGVGPLYLEAIREHVWNNWRHACSSVLVTWPARRLSRVKKCLTCGLRWLLWAETLLCAWGVGVNGHTTQVHGKILLLLCSTDIGGRGNILLSLGKDFRGDNSFRRLPLRSDQLWTTYRARLWLRFLIFGVSRSIFFCRRFRFFRALIHGTRNSEFFGFLASLEFKRNQK